MLLLLGFVGTAVIVVSGGVVSASSNEPMSHTPPAGRAMPRWSVAAQVALFALLIAGLPARSACVNVGPVLFASEPSSGSIGLLPEPTWLLLTPLLMPLEPVPSPTRLYELEATTAPLISSRTDATELKFPATIVLPSVTGDVFCAMPPPAPLPLLSLSAVLLVIVTLFSVTLPVPPPGVTK